MGGNVDYRTILRGNIIIGWEDFSQPFKGGLQGIGCFDSPNYDNWTVENNIVLVDHTHGITIGDAKNTRVINNIVFNPWGDLRHPGITINPGINLYAATNSVIRNNIAHFFGGTGTTFERNLDIDDYAPNNLFVNPSISVLDLRHKEGSPAIDAGSADLAPNVDIEGNPRPQGAGYDIGAYEYQGGPQQCSGTDTFCGTYPSCQNCNNSDGCSGTTYRDYSCSGTSCVYTDDNCSDCSCSCGGYNQTESIANNNCSDTKDNDCDGTTDAQDTGCNASSYLVNIDFENGNNGVWANYNPGNGTPSWGIVSDLANGGTTVYRLSGTVSTPANAAKLGAYSIIQNALANNFIFEAKVRSTSSSDWRDLGIVFGYLDANQHYIAIFNKSCDAATHGIFKVTTAGKQKIGTACGCTGTSCGTLSDNAYHNIKVVRQNPNIVVYFDNLTTPLFTATDSGYATGSFGIGSVNDNAIFDDIKITSQDTACSDTQLLEYIDQWKQGNISMPVLMQKIGAWKNGTGC